MLPFFLALLILWNYLQIRSGRVSQDLVSLEPTGPDLCCVPLPSHFAFFNKGEAAVTTRKNNVCFHRILFAAVNRGKSFWDTTCILDLLH